MVHAEMEWVFDGKPVLGVVGKRLIGGEAFNWFLGVVMETEDVRVDEG